MTSVSSRNILPGWRTITELKERNLTADLDAELGTATNPGYICRPCFLNFEKYKKLQDTLLENMANAVSRMATHQATHGAQLSDHEYDGTLPTVTLSANRKRSRAGEGLELPSTKRPSLTHRSPTVRVSCSSKFCSRMDKRC